MRDIVPELVIVLCRAITQARKASKHAVFSFGEANMGGVRMGKNAQTCYAKPYGYKRHDSELAWKWVTRYL